MAYDKILRINGNKSRYCICISCNKEISRETYLDLVRDFCKTGYIDKLCEFLDNIDNKKNNVFYDIVILDPNDEDYTRIDEVLKRLTDFGSYHDKFYILINDRETVYPLFKKFMDRLKCVDNGGCSSTNITEIYYIEDRYKISEEIIRLVNENEKELNK